MKRLTVKPYGGIANRIRTIEAAHAFATYHSAELSILWEKNEHLNAFFQACFEVIPHVKLLNVDMAGSRFTDKIRRRVRSIFNRIWVASSHSVQIGERELLPLLDKETVDLAEMQTYFDQLAATHDALYIESCWAFYPAPDREPVISIRKDIQAVAKSYVNDSAPFVGVHIRRTDHQEAINHSPIELFVAKMKETCHKQPDVCFYVATDSVEVLNELTSHFGSRIITGVSNRSRNSEQGIKDALLDLSCLSRTNQIWGSFNSTFSERAALLGNVQLEILRI
ncbi:hypothetical protein HNV11_00755 [Spirosoma taeanense]|uniref:Uncharacterized protein n=1 Tax=Spirosoma taeanense TaxID=2735870 RepID=A0A6M5Y3P9_9BACT|nr:hypothetical protein [Spirosoma taeanense]QJW88004.1 hypothetical protein HNV11_00755 [Spirosoma taeanense]